MRLIMLPSLLPELDFAGAIAEVDSGGGWHAVFIDETNPEPRRVGRRGKTGERQRQE
jgi:hypothetical protein